MKSDGLLGVVGPPAASEVTTREPVFSGSREPVRFVLILLAVALLRSELALAAWIRPSSDRAAQDGLVGREGLPPAPDELPCSRACGTVARAAIGTTAAAVLAPARRLAARTSPRACGLPIRRVFLNALRGSTRSCSRSLRRRLRLGPFSGVLCASHARVGAATLWAEVIGTSSRAALVWAFTGASRRRSVVALVPDVAPAMVSIGLFCGSSSQCLDLARRVGRA